MGRSTRVCTPSAAAAAAAEEASPRHKRDRLTQRKPAKFVSVDSPLPRSGHDHHKIPKKASSSGLKVLHMTELQVVFHLPMAEAALKLGVCSTVLKKICRRNGISRWPYRQIRKIDKAVGELEQAPGGGGPLGGGGSGGGGGLSGGSVGSSDLRTKTNALRMLRDQIIDNPEVDRSDELGAALGERTGGGGGGGGGSSAGDAFLSRGGGLEARAGAGLVEKKAGSVDRPRAHGLTVSTAGAPGLAAAAFAMAQHQRTSFARRFGGNGGGGGGMAHGSGGAASRSGGAASGSGGILAAKEGKSAAAAAHAAAAKAAAKAVAAAQARAAMSTKMSALAAAGLLDDPRFQRSARPRLVTSFPAASVSPMGGGEDYGGGGGSDDSSDGGSPRGASAGRLGLGLEDVSWADTGDLAHGVGVLYRGERYEWLPAHAVAHVLSLGSGGGGRPLPTARGLVRPGTDLFDDGPASDALRCAPLHSGGGALATAAGGASGGSGGWLAGGGGVGGRPGAPPPVGPVTLPGIDLSDRSVTGPAGRASAAEMGLIEPFLCGPFDSEACRAGITLW